MGMAGSQNNNANMYSIKSGIEIYMQTPGKLPVTCTAQAGHLKINAKILINEAVRVIN